MLTIYYVSAKILLLKHIETKEKTFLILTAKKGTLTAKKTNQAIVRKIMKEGKEEGQKVNQKINHVPLQPLEHLSLSCLNAILQ